MWNRSAQHRSDRECNLLPFRLLQVEYLRSALARCGRPALRSLRLPFTFSYLRLLPREFATRRAPTFNSLLRIIAGLAETCERVENCGSNLTTITQPLRHSIAATSQRAQLSRISGQSRFAI